MLDIRYVLRNEETSEFLFETFNIYDIESGKAKKFITDNDVLHCFVDRNKNTYTKDIRDNYIFEGDITICTVDDTYMLNRKNVPCKALAPKYNRIHEVKYNYEDCQYECVNYDNTYIDHMNDFGKTCYDFRLSPYTAKNAGLIVIGNIYENGNYLKEGGLEAFLRESRLLK